MRDKKEFIGELDLKFFSSPEFEPPLVGDLNPECENANIIGRNALRALMMGWQDVSPLFNKQVLQAIFVQRDRELLRGMRLAFQEGFEYLYNTQLKGAHFDEKQLEQIQLYLSNCLSLLPFSDITPYEFFQIPQYIEGEWQLIDYKVTPIELTPTQGFKKLFIHDEDRVFAYGLEPIHDARAEPHLIFMGTTYPSGQGFLTQINTDLEPFETVGKKLYRTGLDNITRWLDAQKKKVHVCGMSLGGSLSLLLSMHQGEKLSRVDAHNPAGIYKPLRKSRFDRWDECMDKPKVCIQRQGTDLVARLGYWKEDWFLIDVQPPKEKQGPNPLVDHALNYAGLKGTKFSYVPIQQDNDARQFQTRVFYIAIRALIYSCLLVPYRYILHPIARYVLRHPRETAIMGLALGCLGLFPFLAAPFIGASFTLNLFLNALIIGAFANFLWSFINDKINQQQNSSISKAYIWYEQHPILGRAILGLGAFFLASILFFSPLSMVCVGYLALAMPSFLECLHQGIEAKNIILGLQKIEVTKLHDPLLPRNSSMDIARFPGSVNKDYEPEEKLSDYDSGSTRQRHMKICDLKETARLVQDLGMYPSVSNERPDTTQDEYISRGRLDFK